MVLDDWLQTLAEIAVALAGFSGLLAVLREQRARLQRINHTRLLTIVETSFAVLAFCLVPVLLRGFGMTETTALRLSSLLFLVPFVAFNIGGFRRFNEAAGLERPGFRTLSARLTLVSAVLGFAFGVAGLIGRPETALPSYYVGMLASTLAIGAFNFVGFLAAFPAATGEDGDED